MDQSYKAITESIQHNTEDTFVENSEVFNAHNQNFNLLVSSAFQQFSETDAHYRQAIHALSSNQNLTSDPGALIQLQDYLSEYSNYTSLISTVARKGVSTIETLEKSQ